MNAFIEVPITNFPIPNIATITYADGREVLHPECSTSIISIFSERLRIVPKPEKKTRDVVTGKSQRALNTISAIAKIDSSLTNDLSTFRGRELSFSELVSCLCNLLCFATRRGVSFKPSKVWWPYNGNPVVHNAFSRHGPIQTNKELTHLLERALPKIFNSQYENDWRVTTALRWFIGWQEEPNVEFKFVRLWIVLEMLTYNYWKTKISKSKLKDTPDLDLVVDYLNTVSIPDLGDVPLREMHKSRHAIVHGNPTQAELNMLNWFGPFVEKRRNEFLDPNRPFPMAPTDPHLPDPTDFGSCVYEAADMLSRLLEKVFFSLFDCKDSMFYLRAKYHTSEAP